MPSPVDVLRKRIQNAVKLKEIKSKKGVTEVITYKEEAMDEFDLMIQSCKLTLKEKLGTPEDIEKKVKAKQQKNCFNPTKLIFISKSDDEKENEMPPKQNMEKKRVAWSSDSDNIDLSSSDSGVSLKKSKLKKKNEKLLDSEEDSDFIKQRPIKPKDSDSHLTSNKRKGAVSDEGSDLVKKKPGRPRKKTNTNSDMDSSKSDYNYPSSKMVRVGRTKESTKYMFDSDKSDVE